MTWDDWLKILFGASLALSSGIVTQLFVARQNDLSQRIDEITKATWEFAELASRYWAGKTSADDKELTEAKIVAQDYFIGTLISTISAEYSEASRWKTVEDALDRLTDSATGGDFQVTDQEADISRAKKVLADASALCAALRCERRRLISLGLIEFLRST